MKIATLISALLISGLIWSQPWMKSVNTKDSDNFFKIQESFEQYWKNKKIEKGKGWKQFKRWEWFMEQRVESNGKIPQSIIWKEYLKEKQNKTITGNWTHLGPVDTPLDINYGDKSGSGRINCIEFHPTNQNIFWVGSPSGGVWKTTDGGNSWITTTDDLPSIGISDIAVDPSNPDILYVATGDGDASDTYSIGILKSIDGGATWNTTGLSNNITDYYNFRRILVNPNSTNIVIATSNNGIYRTTNSGTNWTLVISDNFKDIEFMPGNPNVVYATTYDYSGYALIYKSVDGGANFSDISAGIDNEFVNRIELAVTPENPSVIYALCSDVNTDGFYAFYKSSNGGTNWTLMSDYNLLNLLGWSETGDDSGGQGWYDLSLAVSPTNENEVYTGGVNIWKSTNGGTSWVLNAHWYGGGGKPYVHADQHSFDFNLLNNVLYAGNDGGLYKTSNGGTSWTDLSDGLEILQIYRMGSSQTNSNVIVTGAQDNGSMKMDGTTWYSVLGGDGMEALVDYTDEDILYAEYYYGNLYRSDDGGYSFTDIKPAGTGNGAWITPYIIHPANHNTLYIGFGDVYKSTNAGTSWTPISNSLTGGSNLRSLAIAPSDDQTIYAATYSEIYKTENGGSTWTQINSNLPVQTITYIAVSPYNPDMLWVSLSNYTSGEKVFMSDNGGNSWSNFSDGLPNLPVNCIIFENNTNNGLYVGTDVGVYYRNNDYSSWISFNGGIPSVIVMELEIQYPLKKIRAATYGRGIWESDLYQNPAFPAADFVFTVTQCSGTVNFSDISSGVPDSWAWNFGDGNTSSSQNPVHTYSSLGSYNVQLIVENTFGIDTILTTVILSGTSVISDFDASTTEFCSAPISVAFSNLSQYADSYFWDFGDGNTSNLQNPIHTYNNQGDYDVKLIASSLLCIDDTIVKSNFISINPGNSGILNMPSSGSASSQCCSGILKDNGGDYDYSNNVTSYMVINPPNATEISLIFTVFDIEYGNASSCIYDYIAIYDGPNISSPLIGKYCNTTGSPGTIISSGGALTIKQYSDGYVEGAGFELEWSCQTNDILNIDNQNRFYIYPNPTSGIVNIQFFYPDVEVKCLNIMDITGCLVEKIDIPADRLGKEFSFYFRKPAGIYIVELQTYNTIYRSKLIIK
ncbi:MAG: PKD domain-containing protein [Bacteroidota bacterium]